MGGPIAPAKAALIPGAGISGTGTGIVATRRLCDVAREAAAVADGGVRQHAPAEGAAFLIRACMFEDRDQAGPPSSWIKGGRACALQENASVQGKCPLQPLKDPLSCAHRRSAPIPFGNRWHGNRGHLASPVNALLELEWTLAASAILGLLALHARAQRRRDADGLSMARALDAARAALRRPAARADARPHRALADADPDPYRRSGPKTSYRWPHKKHQRPPGIPTLRAA